MSYHLTPVAIIIRTRNKFWEGHEEKATTDGNINCCSHYGKQYGASSKHYHQAPMDRGTWQATVHGSQKSRTWLSD